MHLKKLEMQGFKSFADRTEILFDPGLTGIVGPNGCGKSNVVDAIKWCLGTMSAKSLRGTEMLDVVFSGTEKRVALGMAEVSITFTNEDGLLPVDYQEVTIARRLYRSGESEYLLNKTPCRLRDIRELFMDTGVGVDSYSIIEQGKIDQLLQAGPKDRRTVFEEAAGISKFKARKKESESKLERVQQDLLRIGDVLKELQSRVRSLKIQSSRAEKYRVLQEELRAKKRMLTLHCFGEMVAQRKELAARLVELGEAHAQVSREAGELRALVAGLRGREQEMDRRLQSGRAEQVGKEGLIAQTAERITADAKHAEEMGRMRARRQEELEGARRRRAEAEARVEEARAGLARTVEEIAVVERAMAELAAELAGLEGSCRDFAERIEADKSEALDLVHRQAREQNALKGVESERRTLAARREKLTTRAAQLEQELAGLAALRMERVGERERLEQEIAETKQRCAAGEVGLQEVEERLNVLRDRIGGLKSRETSLESRHGLLLDLERHNEGIQKGVVAVLEGLAAGEPSLTGVRGVLADALRVERANVPIVEAVLAGQDQMLLADTPVCARRAVEWAKEKAAARVSALALDQVRIPEWLSHGVEEIPGVVGRASQFVEAEPEYAELIELLFGDTLVVESLDVALQLLGDFQVTFPMVTRSGERVDPRGIISGGPAGDSMSVLSRKAELRDLERGICDVRIELHEAEEEKRAVFERIQAMEKEAESLRLLVYEKTVVSMERKTEIEALDRKRGLLSSEREVVETESLDLARQGEDLDGRERESQVALAAATARATELEASLGLLEAGRAEEEGRRGGVAGRITDMRIGLASTREQRKHFEESSRRLEREIAELETLILSTEEIVADAAEKIERIERDNEARRAQLEALRAERETLAATGEALAGSLGGLREEVEVACRREHETGERQRAVEDETGEARVEEGSLSAKIEMIVGNTREQLGFDPEVEVLGWVEDPAVDWDALTAEMEEMQARLQSIGNVNLAAIDELKEAEERAEHLAAQEKDLTDAKADLEELIQKIKKDSRDMFVETIEKVKVNFVQLFRKLFGGGRADIILEEGVDILDAGIEIMARPPGKELTSIRLLSGGEKALTALALIMGIFMLKPSPFCVLDEVDAPLDEQNVHRFLALISEFAKETQFLLITHSKVSMAATDVIYGITMEEKGVSKKVSMKLVEEEVPALV